MGKFNLKIAQNILLVSLWFGLITGLLEGAGLFILQQLDLLQGQIVFLGSSYQVIWIAAFFDALLFLIIGLGLVIVYRVLPVRFIEQGALFIFSTLAFFAWLELFGSGRIKIYAVALVAVGLAYQLARGLTGKTAKFAAFVRKTLPWLGVGSLAVFAVIQGGLWLKERTAIAKLPDTSPSNPNILIIVVDTLRADHLSSYGYSRDTDPNISRISQEGVLFENAFSASSWTVPSHASLLTGRWLHEHRADTNETGTRTVPLDDTFLTIGEALMAKGYRTAGFSANFETFKSRNGFGRGFIRFEDYYQSWENLTVSGIYGRMFEYYVLHRVFDMPFKYDRRWAPDINKNVLSWIQRESDNPYFVLINYFDVHSPYIPPEPFRSKYASMENPGGIINTDWSMEQIYVPMTDEQLQGEVDAYDGSIAYVDVHIQDLLDKLGEAGNLDNTLVIITSDHGESFGEHGLLEHHNSLYPEVIKVPLIFWWPGHIPENLRIEQDVSNVAVPATIMRLLGDNSASFPGPSLTELWENPGAALDWPFPIAETTKATWLPPQHLPSSGSMSTVITPDYQLIEHDTLGTELYDLVNDPEEMVNLAADNQFKADVDKLRKFLYWPLFK